MTKGVDMLLNNAQLTEVFLNKFHGFESVVIFDFVSDVDVDLAVLFGADSLDDGHGGSFDETHLADVLFHLLHLSTDIFQQAERVHDVSLVKGH